MKTEGFSSIERQQGTHSEAEQQFCRERHCWGGDDGGKQQRPAKHSADMRDHPEGVSEAGPPADPTLRKQLTAPAADFGVSADGLAHALAEVSQLVGALILELGGHFVGTADPADQLWDHILTRQSLGGTG